jgi:hypothetical protein
MDVIKELEKLDKEIQIARGAVENLKDKRIDWCRENREEIKKLYPIKGKMYQIVDIKNAFRYKRHSNELNDDVYFFKPNDIRFTPHIDFDTYYGFEKPTVKGVVLDCNLNEVQFYSDVRIYITNLKDVNESNTPKKLQTKFTKVYVMIDKNTGYYKIGRSINPKIRERTLQSEKPTIEMLFNHDARVKDEKEIHNMFSDKRVRGEWFDLNGSDLNKIREYFNCD